MGIVGGERKKLIREKGTRGQGSRNKRGKREKRREILQNCSRIKVNGKVNRST